MAKEKTANRPNKEALDRVWDILCRPAVDLDMTVEEVRRVLLSGMTVENDKGIYNPCPACGMNNTAYKISLRRDNADQFLRFVHRYLDLKKKYPDDPEKHWIDCPKFFKMEDQKQRDFTKLKRWGLIIAHPTKAGHWLPTMLGIKYAFGMFPIPKWVCSFHDIVIGYTSDWVFIDDVLAMPPGWSFDTHVRAGAEALQDLDEGQMVYMNLLKRKSGAIRNRTKTSSDWDDLFKYMYDADLIEKVAVEEIKPGPKLEVGDGQPEPDPDFGRPRKPKQLYLF